LTVIFGLVLLVVTLGAFVALVQRAFELTQIGGIFRGLMRKAGAVIDDVRPAGAAHAAHAQGMASDPAAAVVVHAGPAAVVAAIDRAALLRLARETGGFVEVLPMVTASASAAPMSPASGDARGASAASPWVHEIAFVEHHRHDRIVVRGTFAGRYVDVDDEADVVIGTRPISTTR
jgi:hypothetical protein